ncbi:hypothetical protein HDU97_002745 [Phlyctochytrium planicorne]|nr:hypothetical protein HDU97_002745 [Phlyctochytrium planicorne]
MKEEIAGQDGELHADDDNGNAATDHSVYPRPKAQPNVPKEEHSSGFFAREMTAFLAGVMFFTRIRVPSWVNHSMYWLSLSTAYFPLIGVIVGLHGAFFYTLSSQLYSPTVSAIIYTMSTVYLTGAFHEDGLADMFDGFGGGWTKEAVLRIMRDSRVGTYGCLGLFSVVLLKINSISDLAGHAGPEGFIGNSTGIFPHPVTSLMESNLIPRETLGSLPILSAGTLETLYPILRMAGAFVSAHVLGRWSCTYLLWRYPYVENYSAKGKEFLLKVTTARLFWTTISTLVMLSISLLGFSAFWETQAACMIVAVVTMDFMGKRIVKVIDGVIGDCLGATNQIVELFTYMALCVDWGRASVAAVGIIRVLRTSARDQDL